MSDNCRHRDSTWLVCGGLWEWCWRCGAIREMARISRNGCTPISKFVRPVGVDGDNPYPPEQKSGLTQRLQEEYFRRL